MSDKPTHKDATMLRRTERIAGIGSWEWDVAKDQVTWSEGVYQIFQLDPEEGAPSWADQAALWPTEDLGRLSEAVKRAVTDGLPYELELQARRGDGEARTLRVWGFPEKDPDGKVVRLHGSVQDVTELRRAEAGLRESEQRYRTIFEQNRNPIAIIDMEGRYLEANQAFLDFVEAPRETLLGMSVFDFSVPGKKSGVEEVHRPIWETGGTVETEYWINDAVKTLELTITPFSFQGVDAVIGVGKDVTHRKQTEAALRESERFQGRVIQSLVSGLYIYNLVKARNDFISPQYTVLTGWTLDDMHQMGEGFQELFHPDDLPRVQEHFDRLTRAGDGEVREIEYRFRTKDGDWIWCFSRDTVFERDEQGNMTRFIGSFFDITKRKKVEEALRESEEKFHRLTEVIPEVFWLTSVEDFERIEYVSPAFRDIWGEPPERLYDNPRLWTESIHRDDKERVVNAFEAFIEGKQNLYEEFRIVRKDGSIRWIHDQGYPIHDEKGRLRRLAGIAQDITERKRTEEEQRLRTMVLDQIQDGVTVTDLAGTITYVNDAECRMLNMRRDNIIGRHVSIYGEDPEAGATQAKILRETLAKGEWQGEVVNYDANGEPIFLHARTQVVKDAQGRPIALCGIGTDITERKRLEQELRQADKMKALGTLAGGIAHDFNNILSIILGNAEIAMHDLPEWSPAQDSLEEVRSACLRARDLVTQILFFARQKEQAVSPIRLEPVAKECLKMLRASIPSTVEIRQRIEEGLPLVHADPAQVQQIIMNLCTNAGQAVEAEGGTLGFEMCTADLETPLDTVTGRIPPGRYVKIQVVDTGPGGIAPEILDRIFEPFFTTKGVGDGTGLGLAVVHGIVTERNGGIVVESKKGEGTVFEVYLPVTEATRLDASPEDTSEPPQGTERVLFVDDEPLILRLGQRMLERLGYEVETRAGGTDALACFEQAPDRFDLVVTDMTMPGLRGDRLAEEILKIRPDIPVILTTGFSKQISEERAGEIGIRAFVMKPLTQQELASTVRRVLDEG